MPRRYQQDKSLGVWVTTQRRALTDKKMQLERELLDKIGFAWKSIPGKRWNQQPQDTLWNQQYEKMVAFKAKNGHCRVPSEYEQDRSFGIWVIAQRSFHNNNKMRPDRKKQLDDIGFSWKSYTQARDEQWNQQYEKLVHFREKNGHCMLPSRYQQDKALGRWVAMQRSSHARMKLRFDRKKLLDEIGFAWRSDNSQDLDKKHGNQELDKLMVDCKTKNGHSIVPCRYEQDKPPGMWDTLQRSSHTNKEMTLDRNELLDDTGVVWTLDRDQRKNGGSLDSEEYKEDKDNKALANGVDAQRTRYADSKIQLDGVDLLDDVGVVWKPDKKSQSAQSFTTCDPKWNIHFRI